MTPNEKEYMDRYIYQVIRRLPKAQRDEVRMELEELISDMYTDKGSMEVSERPKISDRPGIL